MQIAIALSLIAVIVAIATRKEVMDIAARIEAAAAKLNAKAEEIKTTIATETAQQRAVVQELKDAIAQSNAAAIDAAFDKLEASFTNIDITAAGITAIVPDEEPEDATGTGTQS